MEPSDDLPDLRHIDKHVRLLVRTYARRENLYLLESLIHRIKIQKMISIASKEMCCGCAACEQRCPTSCIVMREDEEGFLYPQTDTSKCIGCGLCEKVCPVLNQGESGSRSMYMRQKHKDSDSAAKFFGRYLHLYSGTDHSEERRGFRCPFRRELGCRTRLYRNARRTRGHAGQQVCAKPYRPHLPAGKRISGIRPSGALFGHSLSNKRFKAFFGKRI